MTFTTRNIILPRSTDILTCHDRDFTCGNKKILQKKFKKIKKLKKLKKNI